MSEAGGSRSKWRVVRVAIVALQDMVYIGRLFFGDADTGDVVWDCDVRPSDGERGSLCICSSFELARCRPEQARYIFSDCCLHHDMSADRYGPGVFIQLAVAVRSNWLNMCCTC